ncbi:E3 ubiquitin-protein ligase RNF144A isoform X2 [Hypomesus transpacificus]|nr:E3 ubiquitin-protein ligase RNF144A isoform X2 [Hypomesus transpacificus]XP_046876258.1 E3 ubiquitin-protein ligase RNF144A isoform X2 [Hypomesus transpacificus]
MSQSAVLPQSPLACPRCKNTGARKVSGQLAVCHSCSTFMRRVYQFCWACRREWTGQAGSGVCPRPDCALRAALLSSEVISNQSSSVNGCPFFRACPGCTALLTHTGDGCPQIDCPECGEIFCFRCLKTECDDDYDDDSDDDDFNDDDTDVSEVSSHYRCTIVDNSQTIID